MKVITGVKSQTRPKEIDDSSSDTTVFVRYNITKSVEIDPVFKTESAVYTYDEKQYTFQEWNKIVVGEIKEIGQVLQDQIDTTQLVLVEILNIIYSPMTMDLDNEEDTDFVSSTGMPIIPSDIINTKYSAIAKMYGGLIIRNLITIDDVPSTFIEEVKQYLENNKKE